MKIPTGKDNEYNDRIERASALDVTAGYALNRPQTVGELRKWLAPLDDECPLEALGHGRFDFEIEDGEGKVSFA